MPAAMVSSLLSAGGTRVAVIAIILVLALRTIAKFAYNIWFHPLAKVPGPVPARFLSSYMTRSQMRLDRAQTLFKLHQEYGSVVRIGPNEVSLQDFRKYREIYGPKASSKTDDFYGAATFLGHENIFSMRNKSQHSARRKLQAQPYSQQAVLQNEDLIARKADVLVRRFIRSAKASASGREADAYEICGLFSLEVIFKCAFNRDCGEELDAASAKMLRAMDTSALMLPIDAALPFLKRFGIGRHMPGFIGNVFRQFDIWVEMTTELIRDFQQHEQALDKSFRFMATPLLTNKDEFLGRKMNEAEVVEEAMGIAFAGSGTTSTTLTYLIYALSKAPDIQDTLRRELQGAGTSLNEVKDLPFLNAVIKETFRLYPTIISTLPRVLDVPVDVGMVLPPGTVVGMQNYIHHRDPSVFPQPNSFVPDRWLQENDDMKNALTPFSLGPRNCVGQNLARAELYLATSKIFRQLKLSLSPKMTDEDMELEDRFNIAPKGRKLLVQVDVLTED